MARSSAAPPAVRAEDQRVALSDVSRADLEIILQIRGDRGGVRLTCLRPAAPQDIA
jgi:hypothetical protein